MSVPRASRRQEEAIEPTNHTFWISIRYSVYTGISTLVGIACVVPISRIGIGIVITCFLIYMLSETFKDYVGYESAKQGRDWKRLLRQAVAPNIQEFGYLAVALFIGLVIGNVF